MSFLHTVRVGFFGPPHDSHPDREFQVAECVELLRSYNTLAPLDLRLTIEAAPRGNPARGFVVGAADGYPLIVKSGILFCPYLTTQYHLSAIGFAAYLHKHLGCSIYSDDEGRFLSLEEFLPDRAFADIVQEVIESQAEPGAAPDPAT
jgi:hypothetical protein